MRKYYPSGHVQRIIVKFKLQHINYKNVQNKGTQYREPVLYKYFMGPRKNQRYVSSLL